MILENPHSYQFLHDQRFQDTNAIQGFLQQMTSELILEKDRGRFSVLTKGIRYAILKQGDVICQEEHESNQKPAFIM